jgi:2-polyprenyl-6-methoxyphenol hydroxylase-like FAD-dependent oxidoreductase
MTPTLGQGANCSIEDAASLANSIYDELKTKTHAHRLSDHEIEHVLCRFSRMQLYRMTKIYKVSRVVGRLLTRDNIFWWLILRYYIPYAGNDPTERALKLFEDAMTLKFIPLPTRSGPRWTLPRKNKLDIFGWTGAAFAGMLAFAFMLLAFLW